MTSSDGFSDPLVLAEQAAGVIGEATGIATHDLALTLGSGWGKAADLLGETTTKSAL